MYFGIVAFYVAFAKEVVTGAEMAKSINCSIDLCTRVLFFHRPLLIFAESTFDDYLTKILLQ